MGFLSFMASVWVFVLGSAAIGLRPIRLAPPAITYAGVYRLASALCQEVMHSTILESIGIHRESIPFTKVKVCSLEKIFARCYLLLANTKDGYMLEMSIMS